MKFTAAGRVCLSVSCEEETSSDMRLNFAVQDTGPGLSAEDQGRLFQLFEQVDGSLTRNHGGTGLGLALCQRLAGLMGGNIQMASQSGTGSVFTLSLRLQKTSGLLDERIA